MVKKNILGVGITDATQEEILEYILQSLKKTDERYYVVTPNPEFLVYAYHHPEFKHILNNARLGLPDGTGVILAGKVLRKNFTERVTGTDLMENLCKEASKQPITVGFLGGGPKIAELTAECLKRKYPGIRVLFAGSEWNFGRLSHVARDARSASKHSSKQIRSLSESRLSSSTEKSMMQSESTFSSLASGQAPSIDLLFVAFGFPKQEEWMSKHVGNVPVKVMMGVGGAFDYISGSVSRAPKWVRSLGFEWLFRLFVQPWRLKRQIALIEFVFLVLKEKLRRKSTMV